MLNPEAQLILLAPALFWAICFIIYNWSHGDDSNNKKN